MKRVPRNKVNITCKPLCDCIECTCSNCPDILKLLSISLDEPECNVKAEKTTITRDSRKEKSNSINPLRKETHELDVANDNRSKKDCVCETMARSIKSGVPNDINKDEIDKQYNRGHFSKNIK